MAVKPRRSQYEKGISELRSMILNGDFAPQERLSETMLAELLEISRTPLRQAIDRLLEEGLLERRPSGGTMVALSVGLKVKRSLAEGAENDVVAVPMMTAIVDANQTVISNQEFGYRVGFDKGSDNEFPVADIEQLVPAEARLVISLRPTY